MSSLKVRQIKSKLEEMFEGKIDTYGIAPTDKERDIKLSSRYLAALAIFRLSGCTVSEAGAAVWDGEDDNGIDAAYYDSAQNEVIVVQAKYIQIGRGEPASREISPFLEGVEDLVENNIDNFGSRLKPKVEPITRYLSQPGTTIRLVIVSTGASSLAVPSMRKIKRLLKKLNDSDDDGIVSYDILGLAEIYQSLAGGQAIGKINLLATILDWSKINSPYEAYFGLIDGTQLREWWTTFGKRIISKNIRHDLGDTDVNKQIRATAISEPENFWYFNNGITLIADDVSRAPNKSSSRATGIFDFKGASIVNGAQTVSTLGKIEEDDAIREVKVSVRVIILRDAPSEFGADVTRTNNLQNIVEGSDFASGDKEQSRIRDEMAVEGVDYQYHKSENYISDLKSCHLREVTTALACAYRDPSYSVAIKTGYARFFHDLSKPPYIALFNPNTSGTFAFNAVRVMRIVDNWIIEKKSSLSKQSGYSWGLLVHGNRQIAACVFKKFGINKLNNTIEEFYNKYDGNIENTCELVYQDILKDLNKNYKSRVLSVLFKNNKICREIYEKV